MEVGGDCGEIGVPGVRAYLNVLGVVYPAFGDRGVFGVIGSSSYSARLSLIVINGSGYCSTSSSHGSSSS